MNRCSTTTSERRSPRSSIAVALFAAASAIVCACTAFDAADEPSPPPSGDGGSDGGVLDGDAAPTSTTTLATGFDDGGSPWGWDSVTGLPTLDPTASSSAPNSLRFDITNAVPEALLIKSLGPAAKITKVAIDARVRFDVIVKDVASSAHLVSFRCTGTNYELYAKVSGSKRIEMAEDPGPVVAAVPDYNVPVGLGSFQSLHVEAVFEGPTTSGSVAIDGLTASGSFAAPPAGCSLVLELGANMSAGAGGTLDHYVIHYDDVTVNITSR